MESLGEVVFNSLAYFGLPECRSLHDDFAQNSSEMHVRDLVERHYNGKNT